MRRGRHDQGGMCGAGGLRPGGRGGFAGGSLEPTRTLAECRGGSVAGRGLPVIHRTAGTRCGYGGTMVRPGERAWLGFGFRALLPWRSRSRRVMRKEIAWGAAGRRAAENRGEQLAATPPRTEGRGSTLGLGRGTTSRRAGAAGRRVRGHDLGLARRGRWPPVGLSRRSRREEGWQEGPTSTAADNCRLGGCDFFLVRGGPSREICAGAARERGIGGGRSSEWGPR